MISAPDVCNARVAEDAWCRVIHFLAKHLYPVVLPPASWFPLSAVIRQMQIRLTVQASSVVEDAILLRAVNRATATSFIN